MSEIRGSWPSLINSIQSQLEEFERDPIILNPELPHHDFVEKTATSDFCEKRQSGAAVPTDAVVSSVATPGTATVPCDSAVSGGSAVAAPNAGPSHPSVVVPEIETKWLGLTDYVKAIQLQDEQRPRIIGLEHSSTITLGKRGDPLKDIRVSVKVLREKKIPIVAVERGGQATLHNQGQLVIYPVLPLRAYKLGVRDYVGLLEDVTIRFLKDFGIKSFRHGSEPGLYTDKGKIAFLGVRIRQGWTSHGLSVNVRNDLGEFKFIRSCGADQATFSKMADFGVNAPLSQLFSRWSDYFLCALHLTQDVRRPMVSASLHLRV